MEQETTTDTWTKTKAVAKNTLRKYFLFLLRLTPHQNIAQTVLSYTFIGTVLLSLPFMNTVDVSFIDNLFTAAAAVSTSGLNSVNFADSYTFLGKLIVLILIQIGGVGYMTFSSFIFLSISQKHRLRHHQQENLEAEVSLPKTLTLTDFLWAAMLFTFVAESIGAMVLFNYFRQHDFSIFNAAWYSIFHSVSAFCTAGFSLWNNSLEPFADDTTMNFVIAALALAGSMGFIVVTDVFNFIRRKTQQISLTTKIIVLTTMALLFFGTLVLFITTPGLTLLEAFFQSVAAVTTVGFNTMHIGLMSSCSLLILMLLMSIGGSPSGTASGIKTTTFVSVLAITVARLRMHKHVEILGRRLPIVRLYTATSTVLLYTFFLFISIFLLTWTEHFPFLALVVEANSALSTGGLSTGITGDLTVWGKLILIATMIVGRIGVMTFGIALTSAEDDDEEHKPVKTEDVAI